MNEQLQQQILAYLQSFAAGLEKAKDFSAEQQAPLVVQEFIRWQIWGNLLYAFYFGLGLFVCYKLYVKLAKNLEDFFIKNKYSSSAEILYFPLIFFTAIFIIAFICSLNCMLKAVVAPRVVVIEKISELTKGVGK